MKQDHLMVEFYPEHGNNNENTGKIPSSEIPILVPRECLKPEKDFEGGRFMKPLRGGHLKKKVEIIKPPQIYPTFQCPGALKVKQLVDKLLSESNSEMRVR
jgi:hypothetical protein